MTPRSTAFTHTSSRETPLSFNPASAFRPTKSAPSSRVTTQSSPTSQGFVSSSMSFPYSSRAASRVDHELQTVLPGVPSPRGEQRLPAPLRLAAPSRLERANELGANHALDSTERFRPLHRYH